MGIAYKEHLDKLTPDYNSRIQYNFEGLQYVPFLKSLDVFQRYTIYSYYLIDIIALNTEIKKWDKHPLPDFFEWSYEEMANFYWKNKDKIKI